MIGSPHILSQTDVLGGLPAVAQRLLGDAQRWTDIVAINRLTPPYLTMDPVAVLGLPQDTQSLAQSVPAGSDSFPLSAPLQLWQPGDRVALVANTAAGILSATASILSYDGATVTLTSALQDGFTAGAQVLSFPPQPIAPTNVMMPGQVILIPTSGQPSFVVSQGSLSDVFGSDAQAPIAWSGGDLAAVSGTATLAQRIRTALLTPRGSLPQAPQFGSGIAYAIGGTPGPAEMQSIIRGALLALPEVQNVTGVAVERMGNGLRVSATVWVYTTRAPLVLIDEPLTLSTLH